MDRKNNYDEDALRERAQSYKHKAQVLRQIQSSKLDKARWHNGLLNYATIIVSAILTVLSFFGADNLHKLFFAGFFEKDLLNFVLNVFVLALLIASFLQMTLRLGEKTVEHLSAVKTLTSFLTDLDDVLIMKNVSEEDAARQIEKLNQEYKNITAVLPSNSDKEWEAAKGKLSEKGKA